MDTNKLYESILTVGCNSVHPKGGVAQVLNTYSSFFPIFRFIRTTRRTNRLGKLFQLVYAIIKFTCLCMFDKRIKIIHIHGGSYHSFFRKRIFIFIGHAFKKKIIYHVHSGEFRIFSAAHKKVVSATLKKVDCIITLSQSWKDFFEKEFRHPNVKILPNAIPGRVYSKREIRFPLHALFLGTLGEKKGIYDLLQVLAMHKEEFAGKFILHVGGKGETEKVQHYIESEGLLHIVKFEGFVIGEEKKQLLTQCNFYILPSYAEGLSISILEAMSYQMPILSTTVGGIPDVVENGINGILIQPGDKSALYQALIRLMSDEKLLISMGNASYGKVQPYFLENVKMALERLYMELL